MKPEQSSTIELIRDIVDLEGRVRRNPYGMMAGALGVGFVLGGGIFSRITERVAGAGLRMGLMAALPLLKEELGWTKQRGIRQTTPSNEKGEST